MRRVTENDFAERVAIEERLVAFSVEARQVADACGLSRREIALRMGDASTSALRRLLKAAAYNASLDTIARFAWACGYDLQVSLTPKKEGSS